MNLFIKKSIPIPFFQESHKVIDDEVELEALFRKQVKEYAIVSNKNIKLVFIRKHTYSKSVNKSFEVFLCVD